LRRCAAACKFFLVFTLVSSASAQSLSQQAAATAMSLGSPAKWTYDHGLVLKGIERVYIATNDKQYLDFIQRGMDHFVADDGSIRTYKPDEYNIDNILPGRNLLFLYKTTGDEK
jgi:unsaturated rhamnogalacturonyl hydrolase